jgi:hypothetical protein
MAAFGGQWLAALAAGVQWASLPFFAVIVAGAVVAVTTPALLPALVYGRGHDLQHGAGADRAVVGAGLMRVLRQWAVRAGVRRGCGGGGGGKGGGWADAAAMAHRT